MGQGILAKPDSKQAHRKGGIGGQPIIRHPLFPAIVALWFGALLGVGSLALRPALLEALVLATGIDAVLPAAGPPLGITARLLLASALGLAGGAVGFVLARRFADAKDDVAPKVFRVAEADLDAPLTSAAPKPASAHPKPAIEAPEGPFLAPNPAPSPAPASECQPAPIPSAAERIASADLAELSHVELIERLAIALQRRQERRDTLVVIERDDDQDVASGPVVQFPDFADRRTVRRAALAPAARLAPQQTEQALRNALDTLQRMSGRA